MDGCCCWPRKVVFKVPTELCKVGTQTATARRPRVGSCHNGAVVIGMTAAGATRAPDRLRCNLPATWRCCPQQNGRGGADQSGESGVKQGNLLASRQEGRRGSCDRLTFVDQARTNWSPGLRQCLGWSTEGCRCSVDRSAPGWIHIGNEGRWRARPGIGN